MFGNSCKQNPGKLNVVTLQAGKVKAQCAIFNTLTTDTLVINNDVTINNDLTVDNDAHIKGKLTVDGAIDPTILILNGQPTLPEVIPSNDGGIWVDGFENLPCGGFIYKMCSIDKGEMWAIGRRK